MRSFRSLAATPDPEGRQLLLDGAHLVCDAHRAGLVLDTVAVAESRLASDTEEGRLARALEECGVEVVRAGDEVFAALSPVRAPSGIVAIARRRPAMAADICARPEAFVLGLVDVQDPGNVGSLIRAAEAAGSSGVIVGGASANPFSWKALRGSMGSALRLPVAAGMSAEAAVNCMQASRLRIVAAVPSAGRDPDAVDWTGRVGLILGGEGQGLTDDVLARCDERVSIGMAAPVESLNVAAAGAILVYAARRQRS